MWKQIPNDEDYNDEHWRFVHIFKKIVIFEKQTIKLDQ